MISHPLAGLDPRLLRALTIRLGALFVFATALMMFVDVPLQGAASPWGIVSLQLAATPYRALRILLEWKNRDVLGYAKLSLAVDFVYLVIYGSFFASLAAWVGALLRERAWSARAAWAAVAAAACDVLENIVLLYEVSHVASPSPWPELAASLAAAKLTLLALSAFYATGGAIVLLRNRYRRPL